MELFADTSFLVAFYNEKERNHIQVKQFYGDNFHRKETMNINVKALWDKDANVWVATGDDVPGLVAEAETSEELIQKLRILIPELLELNGLITNLRFPI